MRTLLQQSGRPRSAFTLVELLIAILVLLVVIIASGKIFGTASKVASLGQANADMMQQATMIERTMRRDLAQLSPEGFLAIQCWLVPNNVNRTPGVPGFSPDAPLLDPNRPENAVIRHDQLLFFTTSIEGTKRWIPQRSIGATGQGGNQQSTINRIYYGHAVQFPDLESLVDPIGYNFGEAMPWSYNNPLSGPQLDTAFWPPDPNTGNQPYAGAVIATQPPATDWILARQATLLADDGGSHSYFNDAGWDYNGATMPNATNSIDDPAIFSSRVDVAASQVNKIKRAITMADPDDPTANPALRADWPTQRSRVFGANTFDLGMLKFPRAEREAPGMNRIDQMLVAPMLAGNCSSFTVDWTYEEGVGRFLDDQGGIYINPTNNVAYPGIVLDRREPTPWFGIPDAARDVTLLEASSVDFPPISDPNSGVNDIESFGEVWPGSGVYRYQAFFGWNRTRAIWNFNDYTPWPTALRITMRLHDSNVTMPKGREYQFVIDLPKVQQESRP